MTRARQVTGEVITTADRRIQQSNTTRLDRYPKVFGAVQALAKAARFQQPHILSFGSSTGEEAHSLSTQYFPTAQITGVDISDEVIEKARASYGDNPNIRFEKSGVFPLAPGSFQIIFAMSVLCRWPHTRTMEDIADLYPFASFEQQVSYLDTLLAPGGLMVIYNANYSFLHAKASLGYDLVAPPGIKTAGFVRRFRADGKFDADFTGTDCIYLKQTEEDRTGARGLAVRDGTLRRIAMIERDIDVA